MKKKLCKNIKINKNLLRPFSFIPLLKDNDWFFSPKFSSFSKGRIKENSGMFICIFFLLLLSRKEITWYIVFWNFTLNIYFKECERLVFTFLFYGRHFYWWVSWNLFNQSPADEIVAFVFAVLLLLLIYFCTHKNAEMKSLYLYFDTISIPMYL